VNGRTPAAFPVPFGPDASISLDRPLPRDGATFWSLVHACGGLDRNSAYLYFLLASDFASTCRLARVGGQPVGFLTAYRPPDRPHTLFVWQVGVLAEARGNRLAVRMIDDVLEQEIPHGVTTLEATVSPDNASSRAMFHRLAAERGAPIHSEPRFPADWFPEAGHEDEDRLVIGPFDRTRMPDAYKEEGP